MKIVLLRHGQPQTPAWDRIPARDMESWIAAYERAGIDRNLPPPALSLEMAGRCQAHVCSDLRRSVESATCLGISQPGLIDPGFRELGLPYSHWRMPRFHPGTWTSFFRILWFLGYRQNSESLAEGRLRAAMATRKLVQLANTSGSVLFAGHGMMNRFIARELLSSGWIGPKTPGRRYWEFGVYERLL